MPAMAALERAWCASPPWRAFTRRVVLPWALAGLELSGDLLELGTGAGANAAELLGRYPAVRLTATDVDPRMLDSARRRLAGSGDRVSVREADATALAFPDRSFDAVVSLLMLHHVVDWERALAEVARVLRPGGVFAGYDLVDSVPARIVHRVDRSPHRLATAGGLRRRMDEVGLREIDVSTALDGLVTRFRAHAPPA